MYFDVSNIFWSFVKSIVNTPFNVLLKTDLYNLISLYSNDKTRKYKINMKILYDVDKYNYDILSECDTDINQDYLIFDSFQHLFNGINILYNYQNNSEHKLLINKCINIMYELVEKKEQNELSYMLQNVSIMS